MIYRKITTTVVGLLIGISVAQAQNDGEQTGEGLYSQTT